METTEKRGTLTILKIENENFPKSVFLKIKRVHDRNTYTFIKDKSGKITELEIHPPYGRIYHLYSRMPGSPKIGEYEKVFAQLPQSVQEVITEYGGGHE